MESRGIRLAARVLRCIGAAGPVRPLTLAACIGMRLDVYAGAPLGWRDDTAPQSEGYRCASPHVDPTRQGESAADMLVAVACARHLARCAGLDEHDVDLIDTLMRALCGVALTRLPALTARQSAVA